MSKQLYIGDWHYRHKNILHLDNRPFTSIEAMDEALIANWNGAVQPEDTVYVSAPFQNVIFRRNGMSLFAGWHTCVMQPYTPANLPA